MFNIEGFLDKFYKNIRSAEEDKKQILEILKKYTGIKFSLTEIEIKNYTAYINTTPAALNKIFIYKEKILQEIALVVSGLKITDIR